MTTKKPDLKNDLNAIYDEIERLNTVKRTFRAINWIWRFCIFGIIFAIGNRETEGKTRLEAARKLLKNMRSIR